MAFGTLRADTIQSDGGTAKTVNDIVVSGGAIGAATATTPTPATDDSTKVATTAFVKDQLALDNTWTGAQRGTVTAVSHTSATIEIDFNQSNNFHIQLVSGTADVTTVQKAANSTDSAAGQSGSIFIQQPTSGTPVNLSGWTGDFRFPAQTALAAITATNAVVDRIDYVIKDANEIHCVSTLNMSQS
jgi:hypothetical protein